MSRTKQLARIQASIMGEPYFPQVQRPVDVTDAEAFPEMELARRHLLARPELQKEWNNG